ncbi:unnamed protein product [Brugia pahangi]|uniref:TPR_REGION domain-containing protein n=1 Tax=Brugia pahangi TaxID=6280 RepID=A0A0N4TW23_BRUPA|nr:unnamed protein product [Brugia pahangi]
MFRRTSDIFRKNIQNFGSQKHAYLGGAVFAAAAIALSDSELKKQPMWYQTSVRKLSFAIKYTNRKGYLDDVILLENLREKLYPYSDSTNTDLLWRYARVLLEIALWTSSADKNRMATFLEAEKVGKKALENESPQSPNASAHKWYGITLVKLMDFRSDKKIDEAQKHLEKAVELDPKDVRSWQYLGIVQYMQKDYKHALESHQKAESLEPGFSNENTFWLGKAQLALGQKKDACESFKKAKTLTPRYRNEYKTGMQAREFLLKKCGMRVEDIPDSACPY